MKKIVVRCLVTGNTIERIIVNKDSFEEFSEYYHKRVRGDFQDFFNSYDKENFEATTVPFDAVLRMRKNPIYDLPMEERMYFDHMEKHVEKYGTIYINQKGGFCTEVLPDEELVEIKEYVSDDYTYVEDSDILVLENDYNLPETVTTRFQDTKISSITSMKNVMRNSEKLVEYLMHFKSNSKNPKIFVETTASDKNQLEMGLKLLSKLGFTSIDVVVSDNDSLQDLISNYSNIEINFLEREMV